MRFHCVELGDMMTGELRLLFLLSLSVVVFSIALAAEHLLVPHVVPMAWSSAPQSLWQVQLAFLLKAIENVAAIVAGLVVLMAGARWLRPLAGPLRRR